MSRFERPKVDWHEFYRARGEPDYNTPEEEQAEARDPKSAAAPKASKKSPPSRERLEELMRKHAYEFEGDGTSILPKSRVAFRQYQKNGGDRLLREKQTAMDQISQLAQHQSHRIARAQALAAAGGDFNKIARLLGAKDFQTLADQLGEDAIDKTGRRSRQVKARLDLADAERAREQQAERDRTQKQRETEMRDGYLKRLAERMAASDHPILREFHNDQWIVDLVCRAQEENWDEDVRETVSDKRALEVPLKALGGASIQEYLFGASKSDQATSAAPEGTPKEPAPQVERRENESEGEFTRRFIADMKQAADADRAAGRSLGAHDAPMESLS